MTVVYGEVAIGAAAKVEALTQTDEDPVTENRLLLAELMAKAGDGDFPRTGFGAVVQLLTEADVDGLIVAGQHKRSGERTTYRNGERWTLSWAACSFESLKLRQNSYIPPLLELGRTSKKALVAIIQEAWIGGVSFRRVDDLMQAIGLAGISKSMVSKCHGRMDNTQKCR